VCCLEERVRKVHDIEKEAWTDELADIHRVVDEELKAVRHMAAGMLSPSAQTSPPSYVCNGLGNCADSDDDDFDVDSLKLKLGSDEDSVQPPIPELYLAQSPAVDGRQSLSWCVACCCCLQCFDVVCWVVVVVVVVLGTQPGNGGA